MKVPMWVIDVIQDGEEFPDMSMSTLRDAEKKFKEWQALGNTDTEKEKK